MKQTERDLSICRKILMEIGDIDAFLSNMDENNFAASKMAQKAVVMTMINISELAKSFSDEFIAETDYIPWRDIRSLRNLAAHRYDAVDMGDIWETMKQDIPLLKEALNREIRKRQ